MDLNELLRIVAASGAVLGVVYWMWVLPERKRKDAVESRLRSLETWQAVAQRDLAAGDKKFDDMMQDIKDIKQTIHRLEKAFAAVAPALAREVE